MWRVKHTRPSSMLNVSFFCISNNLKRIYAHHLMNVFALKETFIATINKMVQSSDAYDGHNSFECNTFLCIVIATYLHDERRKRLRKIFINNCSIQKWTLHGNTVHRKSSPAYSAISVRLHFVFRVQINKFKTEIQWNFNWFPNVIQISVHLLAVAKLLKWFKGIMHIL